MSATIEKPRNFLGRLSTTRAQLEQRQAELLQVIVGATRAIPLAREQAFRGDPSKSPDVGKFERKLFESESELASVEADLEVASRIEAEEGLKVARTELAAKTEKLEGFDKRELDAYAQASKALDGIYAAWTSFKQSVEERSRFKRETEHSPAFLALSEPERQPWAEACSSRHDGGPVEPTPGDFLEFVRWVSLFAFDPGTAGYRDDGGALLFQGRDRLRRVIEDRREWRSTLALDGGSYGRDLRRSATDQPAPGMPSRR